MAESGASPQLENGYTRIANELLEAMCRLHLAGNQWMVLHAIVRKTYGWNKVIDQVSGSQIAEMTGLHRSRIYEALKVLKERGIIDRRGRWVGINKDYTEWSEYTGIRDSSQDEDIRKTVTPYTENRIQNIRKSRHTKDKRHLSKETPIDSRQSFAALATICQFDMDIISKKQRGMLNQTEAILRKKKQATGADILAFGEYWATQDWRGKKGQAPAPSQVIAEWGRFTAWQSKQQSEGTKWIG